MAVCDGFTTSERPLVDLPESAFLLVAKKKHGKAKQRHSEATKGMSCGDRSCRTMSRHFTLMGSILDTSFVAAKISLAVCMLRILT